MSEIARRNPDNTALVERRLNEARISEVVAETVGPTGGAIVDWTDEELFAAELVRVTEVAQPACPWGEHLEETFEGAKIGEVWHEEWSCVADAPLPELKERGKDEAAAMTQARLHRLVERRGIENLLIDIATYVDLEAFHHDGLTGANDHPLVTAFKIQKGLTNPQVEPALIAQRKNQFGKAGDWLVSETNCFAAINAATTSAQIGDALAAHDAVLNPP